MNGLEQIAFGWQCLLGALAAGRRREVWAPWLVLFALQASALVLVAFAAHPAVSWFAAPLLVRAEGEDVLRYPELFRRLPAVVRDVGLLAGLVVTPLVAGAGTRLFERAFRGAAPAPAAAFREAAGRAAALLLAGLPVALLALAVRATLDQLGLVRLSGLSRAAAPYAASVAMLFARAALAYTPALVVCGRRSGPAALAAVFSTWSRGFVPVLVVLLALAPFGAAAVAGSAAAVRVVDRGLPEWVTLAMLARVAVETLVAMLACGAATLAYLGAVERPESR